MPAIIDDGQNIPLFIRGIPGDFDDFYAERRPTLPADRNRTMNRAKRAEKFADWDEHEAAHNELIEKKVVWWNVKDKDGKLLPVTKANAAALPPNLWDQLTNVLLGFGWGDLPPDATPEQKAAFEAAVKAIKDGICPGDAAAEAARKN
ncbi:MAG: hypothetical protein KGL35_17355 [Bradyrhizobium sp.]|nr:hypothetical protein [Bradyrhizobium sp.]